MTQSPFIEDPRDLFSQHIALAVESPIEDVRAFHIGAAQHHAEVAAGSGLAIRPQISVDADVDPRRLQQRARKVILVGFVCLIVAVLGMAALGLSLLRS